MAFKLSPSAKAFENRAKEVWRSTHLVIKALPFVGALSLVYFNPPVNVSRSPTQIITRETARELLVDNWARTDPIISKAAAGELSGKEYADHLNQMYWFDTHSSYNVDTWKFTPALNERFGTFYYFDSKKNEIRQVNMNFDQAGAIEAFREVLAPDQVLALADVFSSAAQRLGWQKEIDYANEGPGLDNMKGYASSVGLKEPFKAYMASRLFAGDMRNVLSFEELERMRKIMIKTPPEKIEQLVAQYKDLNQNYGKAQKPAATVFLLSLLAFGTVAASKSYLRERKEKGGINLDAALARLKQQGKTPSPAEVLREAGVPSVYARIIGASRRGEAWDVQKWFADNAAQSGLQESTKRSVRRAQPLKPEELVSYLASCMLSRKKPLLYGFWGGHKETDEGIADSADAAALQNLRELVDSMAQRGLKKPVVRLIFSDVHSAEFNGIPQKRIDAYYQGIRSLARQHGFQVVRLSSLYGRRSWKRLSPQIKDEAEEHAQALLQDGNLRERLLESAGKHSLLVQGGKKTSEAVVEDYVTKRVFEGKMLHRLWRGVHWSYADPRTSDLLPQHPTLFLYPSERGKSTSPWFARGKQLREA